MTRAPDSMMRRIHGMMFKLPLMISCDEFENFILAYLEDELSSRQKFVFELHLKVCRECRDYLKAYKASMTVAALAMQADAQADLEKVPEDLIAAIMAARNADP